MLLQTGDKLGPYTLVRQLGQGSFGVVWLAEKRTPITTTEFALKLVANDHQNLDAIKQEANLWKQAGGHPNVLPIIEADVYDGQAVIVSEYAPGGTLDDWLNRNGGSAPSIDAAVEMILGILAGLEHLHARRIIHRDLKPANILLQGEIPRLVDFGVARMVRPLATTGSIAGTPIYMAPEAFQGKPSVQTDLWSVGVIFYQLLTGRLPFPISDLMALINAISTNAPHLIPSSVPSMLHPVIARSLERDTSQRYKSVAEFRADLRARIKELAYGPQATLVSAGSEYLAVAITGTMSARPERALNQMRRMLKPYFGQYTTWYCGTYGAIDELAADFLVRRGQKVIAVGYDAADMSDNMRNIFKNSSVPFVDAQNEQVPISPNAPSKRDIFFSTKADLVVLLWDGQSRGTAKLLNWLRLQGKDHLVGFV